MAPDRRSGQLGSRVSREYSGALVTGAVCPARAMRRAGWLVLCLATVSGLLSACSGSSNGTPEERATTTTSGRAASTVAGQQNAACDPVRMLTLAGDWNGYAGGTAGLVLFSNAGHKACRFAGGYPHVRFMGSAGRIIMSASRSNGPVAPSAFTLFPGESVGARITVANASNFPTDRCVPEAATGIQISAPSGSPGTFVSGSFQVCTRISSVTVEPVQDLAGLTGF